METVLKNNKIDSKYKHIQQFLFNFFKKQISMTLIAFVCNALFKKKQFKLKRISLNI